MKEESKEKENKESLVTQDKIFQIVELIKKLNLSEVAELNDHLKETFGISGDVSAASFSSASSLPKEENKEEVVENVSLKITGLAGGTTNKLQIYKTISDFAKKFGNDINIIQAKKIVEEKGVLLNNISSVQAKEIQFQLEEKGINISLLPVS